MLNYLAIAFRFPQGMLWMAHRLCFYSSLLDLLSHGVRDIVSMLLSLHKHYNKCISSSINHQYITYNVSEWKLTGQSLLQFSLFHEPHYMTDNSISVRNKDWNHNKHEINKMKQIWYFLNLWYNVVHGMQYYQKLCCICLCQQNSHCPHS